MGPISFQPAEIGKMATALGLAKYMSAYNYKLKTWRDLIPLGATAWVRIAEAWLAGPAPT